MPKSRASKGLLVTPRAVPNESEDRRDKWLADAEAGFVTLHPVNKTYYSAILKALWPSGHGIPGPFLTENEVRSVVDALRAASGKPLYRDPFRRMRELQGDEGFTSIRKEGTRYQLQSLELGPKREPRRKLPRAQWKQLKEQHDYRCAACGRQEPDVKLSPDHKVPRSRNGSNELGNWQPLCDQCNIRKAISCQGCQLLCAVCSWAFPEDYKPLVISDEYKERVKREADRLKVAQSDLANTILRDYFRAK